MKKLLTLAMLLMCGLLSFSCDETTNNNKTKNFFLLSLCSSNFYNGSTTATRVYGQGGSFITNTTNNGGISATSLDIPIGVAVDGSGNLYVTDASNNRVLYYAAGSTTATRVYGQGGFFTTNTANYPSGSVSATSLYRPIGVAVDGSGN